MSGIINLGKAFFSYLRGDVRGPDPALLKSDVFSPVTSTSATATKADTAASLALASTSSAAASDLTPKPPSGRLLTRAVDDTVSALTSPITAATKDAVSATISSTVTPTIGKITASTDHFVLYHRFSDGSMIFRTFEAKDQEQLDRLWKDATDGVAVIAEKKYGKIDKPSILIDLKTGKVSVVLATPITDSSGKTSPDKREFILTADDPEKDPILSRLMEMRSILAKKGLIAQGPIDHHVEHMIGTAPTSNAYSPYVDENLNKQIKKKEKNAYIPLEELASLLPSGTSFDADKVTRYGLLQQYEEQLRAKVKNQITLAETDLAKLKKPAAKPPVDTSSEQIKAAEERVEHLRDYLKKLDQIDRVAISLAFAKGEIATTAPTHEARVVEAKQKVEENAEKFSALLGFDKNVHGKSFFRKFVRWQSENEVQPVEAYSKKVALLGIKDELLHADLCQKMELSELPSGFERFFLECANKATVVAPSSGTVPAVGTLPEEENAFLTASLFSLDAADRDAIKNDLALEVTKTPFTLAKKVADAKKSADDKAKELADRTAEVAKMSFFPRMQAKIHDWVWYSHKV